MRTVGQLLKEERERKFYTLDEIEKATKIRKELLVALEADNYKKLPPATFVQGFIKNYGKFLNLDTEKLLAVYRREFSEKKNPPRILDSFSHPINNKKIQVTPGKVIGAVVLGLVLAFFGYLWFEYRFLVGAPFLEVTQPADQATVGSDFVKVAGRTDPEASVSINNQQISVDSNGRFSQDVKLPESVNALTVTSTGKSGQSSTIQRTVFMKK